MPLPPLETSTDAGPADVDASPPSDRACELLEEILSAVRIGSAAVRPELLDVNGTAALLGLSRRKVQKMLSARQIPRPLKLGKLQRWRRVDLVDWIAGGCQPTSEWAARQQQKAKRREMDEINTNARRSA